MSASASTASRINGAKSHGPVTPEGKARSSRNAITHGLNSRSVVIPGENPAEWRAFRKSFVESLRPRGAAQFALAETMADTQWRLRRLIGIETGLFEREMRSRGAGIAEAFETLANNTKSLNVLLRYESQLNREFDRAFREFHQLRKLDARPDTFAAAANPNKPELDLDLRNEPDLDPKLLEITGFLPPAGSNSPPEIASNTAAEDQD